jgi:glycosyltransferase involved in cell wall biosynthesis
VRRLLGTAARTIRAALAPPALIWIAIVAVSVRADSRRRRKSRTLPRLVYGPVPIIGIKYMSLAMRRAGYETLTLVQELYAIHQPTDFDRYTDSFFGRGILGRPFARVVGDYLIFAWLLRRYDVFHCFFDGGFLRRTPLRRFEAQLLHLAGKKLVALPYGSDVAVPSRIASLEWRHGLLRNYPYLGQDEATRETWIDYYSRHADYVVACLVHFETLPRWDLLTIHYYPIDTDEWAPTIGDAGHDGRDGPVTVVHAPNHRALKGTEALIRACDELRAEGLKVELKLLERVPNAEVRAVVASADILAEQLILGYALTAMEGMSLGKPVVSNLSDERYYGLFLQQTRLATCPIVSATPDSVRDALRRLVVDPELRRRLGVDARRYVLREHSYAAMAELWSAIYRRVWFGEDVEPADLLTPEAPDVAPAPVPTGAAAAGSTMITAPHPPGSA